MWEKAAKIELYMEKKAARSKWKKSRRHLGPWPDQTVTRKDEKRRHWRDQQTELVTSPFGMRLIEFRRDFAFSPAGEGNNDCL